jgi:hypothetical protein
MIRPEDIANLKPETVALLRTHGDIDHIPIGRDELRTMDSAEVSRLLAEGKLDHMLGRAEVEAADAESTSEPPAPSNIDQGGRGGTPTNTREGLREMSHDEIVQRFRAGHFDQMLGRD